MARNNRNSSRQRIESYVYHNGGVATSDEISLEFKISPKEAAGRCNTSPYLIKVGRERVVDPAFGDMYYLSYWGHLKVLPHEEVLELYWSRQLQPKCMRKVKRYYHSLEKSLRDKLNPYDRAPHRPRPKPSPFRSEDNE